ncbi:MAG: subclass B1 metallo-beta-lactamase [Puniceicoccales bacterium]|jgi:metallo-beta-lactamase class B|nr:subclass B1 metallo-beta-lactamase [Puniceicoccales bacterium]
MAKKFLFLLIVLIQSAVLSQADYQRIKVSDDIEVIKLSEKAYVHVSVSEMEGFGKVASNGLLLVDQGEAFLFDTPVTNEQTEALAKWITNSLHARIIKFVPTHWHQDCMGGLAYLHKQGVESYANVKTVEIAKTKRLPQPNHSFSDALTLRLHGTEALCWFPGGGHAVDNIIVWIPSEKILFGGCMVKDAKATSLGNVADGDLHAWPKTIAAVQGRFPEARIIIPGHGEIGGQELLTHTRELLK